MRRFLAGRTRSARPVLWQVVVPIALLAGTIAVSATLGGGCSSDKSKAGPSCSTAGHPEDFLPRNVQGWDELAGTRETATTTSELQAVVDGGYETYVYYGFQELVHTVYEGSIGEFPTTLDVQIAELGSPAQAMAMYNDSENHIKPPTSEPITPPVGDASRLARSIGVLTIDFVKCAYWVKLYINDTSDDGLSVLQAFAASIEQEMP
jgi:hypothetical protein